MDSCPDRTAVQSIARDAVEAFSWTPDPQVLGSNRALAGRPSRQRALSGPGQDSPGADTPEGEPASSHKSITTVRIAICATRRTA